MVEKFCGWCCPPCWDNEGLHVRQVVAKFICSVCIMVPGIILWLVFVLPVLVVWYFVILGFILGKPIKP